MENALIGNVLNLDFICENKYIEYLLITKVNFTVQLYNPYEKMNSLIKFKKSNNKFVNKIFSISYEDQCLHLNLIKINGETKLNFPLEIINSIKRNTEMENNEKEKNFKDFSFFIIITLHFIDQ